MTSLAQKMMETEPGRRAYRLSELLYNYGHKLTEEACKDVIEIRDYLEGQAWALLDEEVKRELPWVADLQKRRSSAHPAEPKP